MTFSFVGKEVTTSTSDHPFRSFLRIGRGADYAQYGGLPVIIESGYHISEEEYKRRKSLPWPAGPGTFVPRRKDDGDETAVASRPGPSGPQWTHEVIGDTTTPLTPADTKSIDELFQQFQQSMATEKPRTGRSPK